MTPQQVVRGIQKVCSLFALYTPSTKDHSSFLAAAPQNCPLTASITPPSIAPQDVGGSNAWLWQLQHMLGCPTLCQDLFNYLFITFSFYLCVSTPPNSCWGPEGYNSIGKSRKLPSTTKLLSPRPWMRLCAAQNLHAFRFIWNISQTIHENSLRPCPVPTSILGACMPCYLQGIKMVNFLFFPGELLLEPYLISPIDLYECTWPH